MFSEGLWGLVFVLSGFFLCFSLCIVALLILCFSVRFLVTLVVLQGFVGILLLVGGILLLFGGILLLVGGGILLLFLVGFYSCFWWGVGWVG